MFKLSNCSVDVSMIIVLASFSLFLRQKFSLNIKINLDLLLLIRIFCFRKKTGCIDRIKYRKMKMLLIIYYRSCYEALIFVKSLWVPNDKHDSSCGTKVFTYILKVFISYNFWHFFGAPHKAWWKSFNFLKLYISKTET